MRIAIATNESYPHLAGGEKILPEAFRNVGITVDIKVWDDPSINWSLYDTVILRACWGYHQKITQFLAWIQTLESLHVNVQNSPDTLRWNAHKSYLLDLSKRGVNVPKTSLIEKGTTKTLQSTLSEKKDNDFVIKPCYGASAFGIMRTSKTPTSKDESKYALLLQESDVLIQTFVPAIQQGEISAIFIDNKFSHAVIKTPKTGDFRSNFEFGGTEDKIQLTAHDIDKLTSTYQQCQVKTLYARLDVVIDKENITVMELELIEPYLYLEYGDGSANRLAQALLEQ